MIEIVMRTLENYLKHISEYIITWIGSIVARAISPHIALFHEF